MASPGIAQLREVPGCPLEPMQAPYPEAALLQAGSLKALPLVNAVPKAAITLESMEGGKAVYLPVASKFEGAKAQVKIVLACLIKNNESSNLALSNVTFPVPGSSVPAKNMQGESLVTGPIAPGASAWWSNGVLKLSEETTVDNAIYLDAAAPSKVEVNLSFTGYTLPIKITADLAPISVPCGAVRFSAIFQQTNIEENGATTLGRHNLTSSGIRPSMRRGSDKAI